MPLENGNDLTEPVVTYEIPFTKTVKQGGEATPGEETFKLEIFETSARQHGGPNQVRRVGKRANDLNRGDASWSYRRQAGHTPGTEVPKVAERRSARRSSSASFRTDERKRTDILP